MAHMSMRILFALALAVPVAGQQDHPAPKPATPEQLLQAKLAAPFLQRFDWTTDYDLALQRAAQADKLVFGYFTTAGP